MSPGPIQKKDEPSNLTKRSEASWTRSFCGPVSELVAKLIKGIENYLRSMAQLSVACNKMDASLCQNVARMPTVVALFAVSLQEIGSGPAWRSSFRGTSKIRSQRKAISPRCLSARRTQQLARFRPRAFARHYGVFRNEPGLARGGGIKTNCNRLHTMRAWANNECTTIALSRLRR
jgi:hypothetical protein